MYFFQSLLVLIVGCVSSLTATAQVTATTSAGNPLSTACGDIVNDPNQSIVFNASLIYECLTSVPFNAAVASTFIQYYNDTLQFQSTLEYLKNPPTSYQQPGVDLVGGLAELQTGVNNGVFQNQYEFEATLASLLIAAHEGHLILDSGILAVFSFGSPTDIVSVSLDGLSVPKIYIATDIAFNTGFTPSAIKTINDVEVVTYLETFAAKNNLGGLESHTDYNQLFFSAAEGVQDSANIFTGGATFFPGDTITFAFENDTSMTAPFLGVYYSQGPTGPLQTGGDFFNFFVLGFYPDSYDPDLIDNNTVNITLPSSSASSAHAASSVSTSAPSATGSTAASTCEGYTAFYPPCADIAQADFLLDGGVTGYFLLDASIAVLSIPSFFTPTNESLTDFDSAIVEFITKSQAVGMNKVVIDLQSNEGGEPLLAIDTFKHFFPNIEPFAGSRLRAISAANVMGQTLTSVFHNLTTADDEYYELVDSEWVATTKLNANTNQSFASWPEFFGPTQSNGDFFTTIQRYNLSNEDFVQASFDNPEGNFTVFGYGSEKAASATNPPFAAENIIMLSDGICASSCALFMEMMHHQAGVRAVAVGGRPVTGPMQAPAGTRGAILYDTNSLDGSISTVQTILQQNYSPLQGFLPDRSETGNVLVTFASVNLRDSMRPNETTPLQFAYEAADCRIFYTPQTIFNYTLLWKYAADAIWTNTSFCVANSTGFATAPNAPSNFLTGPNGTITQPEIITMGEITSNFNLTNTSFSSLDLDTALYDFVSAIKFNTPQPCKTDNDCAKLQSGNQCFSSVNCINRLVCVEFTACGSTTKQCLSECSNVDSPCGPGGALCTNTLDASQLLCPKVESCSATGGKLVRRTIIGTSQASTRSQSTSGGAKLPS